MYIPDRLGYSSAGISSKDSIVNKQLDLKQEIPIIQMNHLIHQS